MCLILHVVVVGLLVLLIYHVILVLLCCCYYSLGHSLDMISSSPLLVQEVKYLLIAKGEDI